MEVASQCGQAGSGVWVEFHHSAILLDNGQRGPDDISRTLYVLYLFWCY